MGLPNALQIKLADQLERPAKLEFLLCGFVAGFRARRPIADAIRDAMRRGVSKDKIARDILQWSFRDIKRPVVVQADGLASVKAKLYIGIDETNAEERAQFRDVEVPRYFRAKLEKWNREQEERDRDAIDLRLRISIFRRRVFASRTFPSFLKAVIFERDNYTCQVCLRNREILKAAGLHLECDHIVAWEDDGKTTYDNGQTICSDCNKAKHHAKRYLGLVAHLNRTSR